MAQLKFKGPALRALDDWYSTGNVAANLDEADALLRSPDGFAAIVAVLGARGRTKREFVYPKLGVVQGSAFETVARQRYREAIARAKAKPTPVPIKSFWKTGAGNAEFVLDVVDRGTHIEVTILVPGVEVDPADAPQHDLDIEQDASD